MSTIGKRIARIVWRAVAGILIVLVVALATAYAFTFTDRFRDLARSQVVSLLNESFRGEVALERLEGSVWGDLALSGLAVRYGGKEIARFPHIVLRYALLPVLRGRVVVTGIEAAEAHLELEQDAEGNWNLLQALSSKVTAPPSEGGGLAVDLESVVLRDAAIRVTPHGSPTYFVTGTALEAAVRMLTAGTSTDLRKLTLHVAREGLPSLTAEAALTYEGAETPDSLAIRSLSLRTEHSAVALRGKARNLSSTKDLEVDAKLDVGALAPADIVVFVPQWSLGENVSGNASVSGKMSDLKADVSLVAAEAKVDGQLRANLAADTPRYDGHLQLTSVDLARIVAGLGIAGVVSGEANAKGVGSDLGSVNGEARLDIRGLAATDWQLGDVAAKASIADRRAKLDAGVTIEGAKRASLDGQAELGDAEAYRVTLALAHFNPKKLSPLRAPLAGDLNLLAKIEGHGFTPAKTHGRAEMRLSPSKVGAVALNRGKVDVALGDGRAKISEATIEAKNAKLAAKGDVGLQPEDRGRLQVDLAVDDLQPWLALAGQDGAGSLTLHGTAAGGLGNLDGEGRLQAAGLRLATSTIARADVTFDAHAIGQKEPRGRVVAKLERLEAGVALAQANAELAMVEARRLTVDLKATDAAGRSHHLSGDARFGPSGTEARLADLALGSPDGAWRLVRPVRITQRDRQVAVEDFQLANGDRRVKLDGTVAASGRQALRLEIDRFTLETLQPLLAGAPEMRGIVAATADLGGTAAAPRLDAKANVTALAIAGQPYDGITASAHYDAGRAALEADFRQDATHTLTARAALPLVVRWDPSWQSSVSGDANLSLHSSGLSLAALNAFTGRSVRKINGELRADVTATGPFAALRPRGTLEVRGGEFLIPATGISVSEGTIQVSFDPTLVRFDKLFARSGDGTIEGSGKIPLVAGAPDPLNVAIEAKNFRAASNSRYRADVGGQLALGGTTAAPEVRGRVEVLGATLRPDLAFLGKAPKPRDETIEIVTAGAPKEPPPASQQPATPQPLYQNSAIDVVLAIHRNTWVRHENAAVELEGEVHATKKPAADLELVGEIRTVRGWAVLQGRRFAIAQGTIAFTGGKEIDPALDVVADYKKGEYVVHAIVSGTANQPALTLASDPQLEQADILSVLLFGKPAKDLNDGQKTDLKKQAAEMAGAYAFTEIGQSVTRALGLESQGIQVEELSTERVALGTYLTEKTYVTLGQDIGNRQGQELSVEYQFVPNWSVQTSTSTIGGSGIDLIWHRRY